MEYTIDLSRYKVVGRVSVESGGFFSRSQLLIDGSPAPQGKQCGDFILPREGGEPLVATLRGVMLDPVPLVLVERDVIRAAPPLTLMQTLFASSSFIIALTLSIVGLYFLPRHSTAGIRLIGYLCMSINLFMGMLLGFTSMIINRRILRSEMSRSSQIFGMGAMTIIVTMGFLFVFILLLGILHLFSDLQPGA